MKPSSVLDRVQWLIYSAAAILLFCYIAMAASSRLGSGAPDGLIAAGVVLAVWAVLNGVVQRILRKSSRRGGDRIRPAAAEAVALIVILAGTLVWRICTFAGTELCGYYDAAKVVSVAAYDPKVTNGAANFYLRLLHGLLWLFGNTPTVAYVLQLVLYFGLMLVYYFVLRSLCGVGTGLAAAALLGASPLLGERFLADQPELLAGLLLFAGLWLIVTYWSCWNRYQEQRSLGGQFCRCAVTGALIGLAVYMDAAAILLVPVLVCVLIGGRKPAGEGVTDAVFGFWNRRPVALVMMLVFGVAAFGGMLYAVGSSPDDWLGQYTTFVSAPSVLLTVSDAGLWEITIVSGLLALGVFTAPNQFRAADLPTKTVGRLSLLMSALLLAAAEYCGILTDTVPDSSFLLYLFLMAMAGMSAADLFATGSRPETAVRPEEKAQLAEKAPEKESGSEQSAVPEKLPEQVPESEAPAAHAQEVAPTEQPQPEQPAKPEPAQVTFLESPLPLPKKHVRKTLDYDIEVAEDDDYDIP